MLSSKGEAIRTAILTAILLFAIAAMVWHLSARYAHAKWREAYTAHPADVQRWFKQQTNALGQSCCDSADGHAYYGDYTLNADGSVTIGDEVIPKEKVLTGPNPTGSAVWFYLGSDDRKTTYCFALGGGT